MKNTISKPLGRFLSLTGCALLVAFVVSVPLLARAETIDRELQLGMTGSDVSLLQTFLAADPSLYPRGLVTGYFGSLTKSAVMNFQLRNGISPVGRVGPVTLSAINVQMANGVGSGTDLYAPVITSVQLNTSTTGATVSWTTNEASRGKLYYSTSPIQLRNLFDATGVNFVEAVVSGTLAPYDAGVRSAQTVSISGLTPNSLYYYLVEALDASNNVSITLPSYFRTAQ